MATTNSATLRFLRQPDTYGVGVAGVRVIETHMSWVFLAGADAYKLKKPLQNASVDFRTVAARCAVCHEEVRLNRRLAPDVYLGVASISQTADGSLAFCSTAERVDCVVHMRRLPEEVMLSYHLTHACIDQDLLEKVALCIAQFHRGLTALRPSPPLWRASIAAVIDENESVLSAYLHYLHAAEPLGLCQQQRSFLRCHADWIDARIHQGRLVEGHGDLRAEHVFTYPSVGAIDCLEFSAALRQLDCADEIGFLALDCERLAGEAVGRSLLRYNLRIMQDGPPPALLHFYQSLRAVVRARLALVRLEEQSHRPHSEWIQRADQWLQLARKHARNMQVTSPALSG